MISLYAVDVVLELNHLVGAVHPERVELVLNLPDGVVNRPAQLRFLFSSKNILIFVRHIQFPPL